ncbi:putative quinol monooxygenase [Streptomyces sp. GMR22]|uniref:putative quinol monooxygenase n=1 Tax=Streptomyces sp. GMR22 TaxID=2759524 RepID=UPI0015FE4FB7|nr:antibiotic biosynthesis monooxygenase [Streptomyces sp. GMR22]MBA6439954.1 antibiotic biosynthesis monooxygenase [Streptomyces sp. GMR22]
MPDQNPVTVIARFTPAPDRAPQLQALLEGMIAPTRSEPGCRSYDLYTTGTQAPDFVLLERYQDFAALEAHRTTAHYTAYRAQLSDLLAEPVEVSLLRPVNVIG